MARDDLSEERDMFNLMAAAWLLSVVGFEEPFTKICTTPQMKSLGGQAGARKHIEKELKVAGKTLKAIYDQLEPEMGPNAILFLARGLGVEAALDRIISA